MSVSVLAGRAGAGAGGGAVAGSGAVAGAGARAGTGARLAGATLLLTLGRRLLASGAGPVPGNAKWKY